MMIDTVFYCAKFDLEQVILLDYDLIKLYWTDFQIVLLMIKQMYMSRLCKQLRAVYQLLKVNQ